MKGASTSGNQEDRVSLLADHWWREVAKKVRRAVVFMDAAAAEALHWRGGLHLLEKANVVGVRDLSSFESCGAEVKKASFLVSGPVVGLAEDIVREIIVNSSFEYCQVSTVVIH